jgi:hypothetical protein
MRMKEVSAYGCLFRVRAVLRAARQADCHDFSGMLNIIQ